VPRYGRDIRDRDLPQETGQARALDFTKGCYIGQEIVERIRSRGNVHRKYTGFYVDGELPAQGSKIQAEDKDVGEITSVAALPSHAGELRVALGYIRRDATAKNLKAGASAVKVADLPFQQILSD
jgi:aminomethyltransferase